MSQEYFIVALSPNIDLAIPLDSMGTVTQLELSNICPVPGIAEFWHGAINHKGSLLWVLDSDRYFTLSNNQNYQAKKMTAVVIKQNQADSSKKAALITPQLVGIIALEPDDFEPLADDIQPAIKQCCSASIKNKTKRTFILDPNHLLEQLSQQSSLVAA